jgi:hypothetical protein
MKKPEWPLVLKKALPVDMVRMVYPVLLSAAYEPPRATNLATETRPELTETRCKLRTQYCSDRTDLGATQLASTKRFRARCPARA